MSVEYNKPLPAPQKWTMEFWKGTKENKLLLKRCKECGHIDFPPYLYCTECMSMEHEWIESSKRGTVYSFSTTYLGAPPSFVNDQPYTLIFVDLEEGVRMLSRIVDCKPEDVKIGMEVEAVFDAVTGDTTLVMFRPVK
ncbi:MAG: Zn-ribbon domain-containing OB-fold protein [Peptococcaceae bacterium]|nr:Zn-ribbon domain-containing OB-fold protein [Peptococcaceae bacterium]